MLLIATRNQGKLKESKFLLKDISKKIICLNDLKEINKNFDVAETGETYQENATLKAIAYGQKANILTLADDSGMEINALPDQLGVYSGRYAQGNFQNACFKILKSLKNLPPTQRIAKFVCVLALFNPKTNQIKTFYGESLGLITFKPIGNNGFGYDSIFYSLDLKKTYAQANFLEKSQVSHRARAFQKLIQNLNLKSDTMLGK